VDSIRRKNNLNALVYIAVGSTLLTSGVAFIFFSEVVNKSFWRAPYFAQATFFTTSMLISYFTQRHLDRSIKTVSPIVVALTMSVSLLALLPNFAQDLSFCLPMWFGDATTNGSYCRVAHYFSIEKWFLRFVFSILQYAGVLGASVIFFTVILYKLRSKIMIVLAHK
jgi:hypothetical protein